MSDEKNTMRDVSHENPKATDEHCFRVVFGRGVRFEEE